MELISEPTLTEKIQYFLAIRYYESRFTIMRRTHPFDLSKPLIKSVTSTTTRCLRRTTREQTILRMQLVFKWDWWKEKCNALLDTVLDEIGMVWCFERRRVDVSVVKNMFKERFWPMKLHPDTSFVHVRDMLNGLVRARNV